MTTEQKEKIKGIIFKYLMEAFNAGLKQSPFDADNSEYWSPHFDYDVAPKAVAEIENQMQEGLHDSFLGFSGAGQTPIETAAKILEDGINDGRYADILDTINVDTETPFFKAVVHFAEDYASQFKEQSPEKSADKDVFEEAAKRYGDDIRGHELRVAFATGFEYASLRSEQRQECQHERHYSEIEGYAFCSKCGTPMQ